MRMSSGQKAASAPILHLDNQTQQEYWTMFRDKISGIAVAATLGTATLLGATHANAQIDLDREDQTKPAVLFSSELVEAAGITGVGDNAGKTWYQLTGAANTLDIKVKLGHTVLAGDTVEVKVDLTNMVFGTFQTRTTLSAAEANGAAMPDLLSSVDIPTDAELTGKSSATLLFTVDKNAPGSTTVTWGLGNETAGTFGIAPSGTGGITATINNLTADRSGGTPEHMASYPNAVQLGSSFSVGSTPGNLTADVADGFKSFTVGRFATTRTLTGNLGRVFAELATPAPVNPANGTRVTMGNILDIGATASKVTLTGNFGDFLTDTDTTTDGLQGAVTLDTMAACNSAGENTEAVTIGTDGKASAVYFAKLPNNQLDHYLCITVAGETAIPVTGAYMAVVELERDTTITQTLPSGTHSLGMIERNGTTIHIPFVTTHQQYHQRFMIVNNGADTTYEFTFMPEEGTTAAAGMKATGEIDAGETIVLDAMDVVMLTGKSRTAATVTIPLSPGAIEMSTILRSKEHGAMEITVLQPE
jgi:hypothetical protein